LRSAVERLDHRDQDGGSFRTTASFGVASLEPGETGVSTDALLSRADEALYVSKKTGRNRVAVWKPRSAA
jgi:two-component system chemotaxis family response regulator WspR